MIQPLRQIDIDLTEISDWDDLHERLSDVFGFPYNGRAHRGALEDHLGDLLPGRYCLVSGLKKGDHLTLGIFGFGGLKRRNKLLSIQFDKLWEDLNNYAAQAEGYDSDFVVLKTVDKIRYSRNGEILP